MAEPRWLAATEADGPLIFRWRDDAETRRQSLSSERFDLAHHMAWLRRKLADPRCRIVMAARGGRKLGQLRLDADGRGSAVVSLTVAPEARGKGLGTWMLRRAPASVGRVKLRKLVAVVKPDNVGSVVAFVKAGFVFVRVQRAQGAVVYRLEKALP